MLTRAVAADGTGRHTTTIVRLVACPAARWSSTLPAYASFSSGGRPQRRLRGHRGACAGVQVPGLRAHARAGMCCPDRGRRRLAGARSAAFVAKLQRSSRRSLHARHPSPHRAEEALEEGCVSRGRSRGRRATRLRSRAGCSATSELSMSFALLARVEHVWPALLGFTVSSSTG